MNKFAIITGGSRGLGFAVAEYLGEKGYDLALIARNPERLEEAKSTLSKQFNKIDITIHAIDVSHSRDAYLKIKEIIAKKGRVDVLFNNAGIAEFGTSELDIDDFEKMQAVNVNGVFAVAKAVAEKMKEQKSGYIFNLASKAGKRPLARLGGYCASKYAVVGFSDSLYQELMEYGVKVTALCPSVTNTDMSRHIEFSDEQKIQLSDIVDTVDYLLKLSPYAVVSSVEIDCRKIVESHVK